MSKCACGRPTDLTGCRACAEHLVAQLDQVPMLVLELDTTIARLARVTTGGGRNGEPPLLFHPHASDTKTTLRSVLTTWAAHVATHRSIPLNLTPSPRPAQRWYGRGVTPQPPNHDKATLAARWLAHHIRHVRAVEAFRDLTDAITDAIHAARRAIDRPADRAYAGPCDGTGSVTVLVGIDPCGYDLLADPEWTWVRCRVCGHEYDVALRRQWMLDDLRQVEGSSRQVAKICTALGVKISESTIRMWVHRKKLQPRQWKPDPLTGQPRPQYRVDDILTIAAGHTITYDPAEDEAS